MSNVCEHGQLKRQCYTCELLEEIEALKARNELLERVREEAECTQEGNEFHSALRKALKACEAETEKEAT